MGVVRLVQRVWFVRQPPREAAFRAIFRLAAMSERPPRFPGCVKSDARSPRCGNWLGCDGFVRFRTSVGRGAPHGSDPVVAKRRPRSRRPVSLRLYAARAASLLALSTSNSAGAPPRTTALLAPAPPSARSSWRRCDHADPLCACAAVSRSRPRVLSAGSVDVISQPLISL
jgi:hypothetical protein